MILSKDDADSINYHVIDQNTGLVINYVIWADDEEGIYKQIRMEGNKPIRDEKGDPLVDTKRGNIKLKRIQTGFKVSPEGGIKLTRRVKHG